MATSKKDFKINQKVTYRVCNSVYTGTIVKINDTDLVIVDDDESARILYNAGYAVGSNVSFNQITYQPPNTMTTTTTTN